MICEYFFPTECCPVSKSSLSLPLQIHLRDWWQTPSSGQVVLLLLETTQIYKHSDYEPRHPFHGAKYRSDLLHKHGQVSLEFITWNTFIQDIKHIQITQNLISTHVPHACDVHFCHVCKIKRCVSSNHACKRV